MKRRITNNRIRVFVAFIAILALSFSMSININDNITLEDSEVPLGAGELISARDAGLIPNDNSQALSNANLLISALNQYQKIVIDDVYYISTPTEKLTARNIDITGLEGSKIISSSSTNTVLFDPNKIGSLILTNLNFINENDSSSFFIAYGRDKSINKVETVLIDGCTFTGSISLYRLYGNQITDPDSIDYSICTFVFNNNTVLNTQFSFIVINDVPVNNCEITNNTITNFMYTFINIGINNNTPVESKLYEKNAYMKVEGNIVKCEDNWWGNTSSGSYYTFVLFEGKEVLYNNNYVEGMKANKNIAIYDAYLSAEIVNYTNNTWKNNICFYPTKTNNTLIKSKGGGTNSLIRNYSGNTFIIDEDFAERIGQPKEYLFVDFISLTKHAESYTITDNTFDVYDLRFPSSSLKITDYTFTNNIVKARKASGSAAILRLNDEYLTHSINISNNQIEIDEKSEKSFNLVKVVDGRKTSTKNVGGITVNSNRITAHFGYFLYDVLADNLSIADNTIIDLGDSQSGFAYGGSFTKTNIENNTFESQNSKGFYEGRQLYGAGTKRESISIDRSSAGENNGMFLDKRYNADYPTTYTRVYNVKTDKGEQKFSFTFTLSYNKDSGYSEVTFADLQGRNITYRLSKDNSVTDGNGQEIAINSLSGDNIDYKVKFLNKNGISKFYILSSQNDFNDFSMETIANSIE